MKHAKLGASKAERWSNCPGSVRLSEGRPESRSDYADEGTAAHLLAASCLTSNTNAALHVGESIPVAPDMAVQVTDDMAAAVQVYLDYVRRRQGEGMDVIGIEQQVDFEILNPPAPMFGTADAILWLPRSSPQKLPGRVILPRPSILEVVDYKHGQGVYVPAEENLQGAFYAVGAVLLLGQRADKVKITIVQPRIEGAEPVRTWEIEWDRLVELREQLISAARDTADPDAPLIIGEWCRFCPALPVCPAHKAVAQDVAQTTFGALTVPESAGIPIPAELQTDELSEIMDAIPLLRSWLSAVEQEVYDRTEAGERTGYKLVPKRGVRRWNNEREAEQVLRDCLGDEAFTTKLVSPAQAEKAAKRLKVSRSLDGLWSMVSSGNKLAPESDARPSALPPSVEEVFEEESE